jgi:hypothetical protein
MLTSSDPEPPVGTVVRDAYGTLYRRSAPTSSVPGRRRDWFPVEADGSFINDDPETWARVAGNQGPVEVVEKGSSYE